MGITRITTHVLDVARGKPAGNMLVHLEHRESPGEWQLLASARTDGDGRCNRVAAGKWRRKPDGRELYRLSFDTAAVFCRDWRSRRYTRSFRLRFRCAKAKRIFTSHCCLSPFAGTRPTGEAERMISLGENKYGKSRVRLVRVKRQSAGRARLSSNGTLEILAPRRFRELLYRWRQQQNPANRHHEEHGVLTGAQFIGCVHGRFRERVDRFLFWAAILLLKISRRGSHDIAEKSWDHITAGGKPHPTAFVQSSGELQAAKLTRAQGGGRLSVVSGIRNLVIMKTADSAFEGYIPRIRCTTLPETS